MRHRTDIINTLAGGPGARAHKALGQSRVERRFVYSESVDGGGDGARDLPANGEKVAQVVEEMIVARKRRFDACQGLCSLKSQPAIPRAVTDPASCAAMKLGADPGAMPAKVLLRERAIVTAGLANDVEAVNQ